jgi:hypothetical protein
MLGDFFSQGVAQLNLFDDNAPRADSEQLMTCGSTQCKDGPPISLEQNPATVADETRDASPR